MHLYELGLNDTVTHEKYGLGVVIKCTEKPTVTIKFNKVTKVFSEQNEHELKGN